MTVKWKLLMLIVSFGILICICLSFRNEWIRQRLSLVMTGHPFARIVGAPTFSEYPTNAPAGFFQGLVYSHKRYVGYLDSFGYFVDKSLVGRQEETHADALQEVCTWLVMAFLCGAIGVLVIDLLTYYAKVRFLKRHRGTGFEPSR